MRESLHGILYVLRRPSPRSFADALRRVDAFGKALLAVRQIDPRRVPHKYRARAPDHVACVVHVEVPGQRAPSLRPARRIVDFVRSPDHHRLVAVARLLQPRYLRFGQHVFRIDQLTRSGHDHLAGHSYVIVKVTILQVKLAAEVGERVPTAKIVIDAHPRIPLRNVVDISLSSTRPTRCGRPTRLVSGSDT